LRPTGGKMLPGEIADQIVDRTDGVPLFVEELTKAVIESGVLADAGDHFAVTGSVAPVAIPTSLHASLLARLDRLAPVRPHTIAMVRGVVGDINRRLGCDPVILLRESDENLAYAADHGFTYWAASALRHHGSSLLALGRVQEALKELSDALAKLQATGALTTIPSSRTSLAQALGKAGRPTDGLAQLDEAERQIEATQERWTEADMHHLRGELLVCLGDLRLAEQSLQRAISVARGQTAKFYEVRAATSLAPLWQDQGKRTEAHDLLAPIYGWFTEGFDTPVLQSAKAVLDELA